jgi:hypothetical protein
MGTSHKNHSPTHKTQKTSPLTIGSLPMKPLTKEILQKFLQQARTHLKGEWVLIGGTLLPLLGLDYRSTTDIDLVGLSAREQGQALSLMELAERLGLPVETINQAGAHFLNKIPRFKNHLILLEKGLSAKIYRPDLYLYVALKIQRLSESDMNDCLKYLEFSISEEETGQLQKALACIEKELKKTQPIEKARRLRQLHGAFEQSLISKNT